jgi:hypothetical protein
MQEELNRGLTSLVALMYIVRAMTLVERAPDVHAPEPNRGRGSMHERQPEDDPVGITYLHLLRDAARLAVTPGVEVLSHQLGKMRRQWSSHELRDQ